MKYKTLKVNLRASQIPFISSAIEKFIAKCPMRFSSPEIVKGSLRIDPHDFLELCHYIDVNFENDRPEIFVPLTESF
ncbi:MAG: hypothetical protein AB7N80_14970 [Bdellovibrionales bacterium]